MSESIVGRVATLRARGRARVRVRAAPRPVRGIRNRSALDLGWLRLTAAVRGAANARAFVGVREFAAFVGYARSGSTLVGALLDAHPHAAFAHELDALGFVGKGFGRRALFQLLAENARDFRASGGRWTGYCYRVPTQWQGRFDDLQVIGDKKAAISAARLYQRPELLDALRDVVKVPVKLIHVVRNPYDNIATKILRRPARTREWHTQRYFHLCAGVRAVKERADAPEMLDVRIEDVIARPRAEIARLLDFLELEQRDDYIRAASAIVYDAPRLTRHHVDWTAAARAEVRSRMREFPFLAGYSFEG